MVDAESVEALPDEYLHEPELALGSGEDGLDATRQIILQAAKYLNPKGVLLVEIGHNREVLEAAYPELPFTWVGNQRWRWVCILVDPRAITGVKNSLF